jgi:hypothetical protein
LETTNTYKPLNIFIALLAIGFLCVLSFYLSRLGYNPTDDGVILSLARRMFMWQAPHKEFISIRPTGSGLLHMPELLMGGNYVFLISRLVVCFQFACISYFSILLLQKASSFTASFFVKTIIFVIAFFLGLHSFPLIAWTTIDAIFCVVVGTYFSTFENKYIKQIGYGIAGFAIICKQNFIFMPFLLIILNKDVRNLGVWLFTILPTLVYVEMIFFSGSTLNAIEQFTARTELFQVGVKSFVLNPFLWIGFGFSQLFFGATKSEKFKAIKYLFLLYLPVVLLGILCYRNSYRAIFFAEFGILISLIIIKIIQRNNEKWFLIFVAILAWSSAISLGWNSTGLAAGIVWIALLTEVDFTKKWLTYVLVSALIFSSITFLYLRTNFIYRDNKAQKLTFQLDNIYGFAGIKTNKNTAMAMNELNGVSQRLGANKYCVIADFAGFWATNSSNNPASIDWLINDEMPSKKLLAKAWKKIDENRNVKYIITQKYYAEYLADSLVPIRNNDANYTLIDSVKMHYIQKWEGKYFTVFTKPMQQLQ